MPRRCDLWRIGIVDRPIEEIARHGLPDDSSIAWLSPDQGSFRFDADPFGIRRGDRLHLFVERYDYRTRHGVIDHLEVASGGRILDRHEALREPWHLSYPFVFEADGETWLLPEAYRSGALTLYRAVDFPRRWEPAARIALGSPAIDPTLLRHAGRWWLFSSGSISREHRLGSLNVAWSEALTGPWTEIGRGPVRLDARGARPGGRPFELDGEIVLPVQDCSRTYGGAIRLLHFERLEPDAVAIREGRRIAPRRSWSPWNEGLHTLSGCGPVTLIDAKRVDRSGRGWLIDAARWLRHARSSERGA